MFSDIPATGSIRYPYWMVILVTPLMLIMAVVQAAIDRNKFIMNLIGAIVSAYKINITIAVKSWYACILWIKLHYYTIFFCLTQCIVDNIS